MRKLLVAFFCLFALTAGAQPVQNNSATNNTFSSNTVANVTGTTVAGSKLALIVALTQQNNSVTGLTCHWDTAGANQLMTNLGNATNTPTVYLFGLRNPSVVVGGNAQCTWTGPIGGSIMQAEFSGVIQTNDATAFQHCCGTSNTGSGTTAATTVANVTGGLMVDVVTTACCNTTGVGGGGNTLIGSINNSGAVSVAMSSQSGAGSLTNNWAISGGGAWADAGVSLAPDLPGGGVSQTLMGVGQ